MKKFANFRLPVILACSLAVGIAVAFVFKFFVIDSVWSLLILGAFALTAVIVGLTVKKSKPLLFILLAAACFTGGFFNGYSRMTNFETCELTHGNAYFISGEIEEINRYDNFSSAKIKNLKADNKNIDGKMYARIPEKYSRYIEVGYKIEFAAEINCDNKLFKYGEFDRNAEENIKYSCLIADGFNVTDKSPEFFEQIRASIRGTLFDNLSENTAAICYGMLVGDTDLIGDDAMTNFRLGGVAHIFAVSGLHIGLVYGLAYFVLKKLILNSQAASLLSVALVFFYAGVCGFTLSSVRAAIMCAVNAATKLFHFKYDGLNSLAFSVLIVLCVTPLSLFSLGYRLSVCAVAGILILSKNIEKAMNKARVPKKISSAAGVTFGAQLGTMPVMLNGFGYLSGAGFLLNLVIIPVISVLFSVMFFGTIICTIIPAFAAAVMPIAVLPLEGVLSFLLSFGFENSIVSGFGAGLFIPLYYIGILSISDKLNLSGKLRFFGVTLFMAALTVYVIIMTYTPSSGYNITVSAKNSDCVLIKSPDGNVLIIDENCNPHVSETLDEYYTYDLDGVIILGGEDCVTAYGKTDLKCKDVYVCKLYIEINPYDYATVHYEKDFTLAGMDFSFADGKSLYINCDGISIGVCIDEIPFTNCDLLISRYENTVCEASCNVYFGLSDYKYNIYDYGDINFTVRGGTLDITSVLPRLSPLH